jgi:hypothetical protein
LLKHTDSLSELVRQINDPAQVNEAWTRYENEIRRPLSDLIGELHPYLISSGEGINILAVLNNDFGQRVTFTSDILQTVNYPCTGDAFKGQLVCVLEYLKRLIAHISD